MTSKNNEDIDRILKKFSIDKDFDVTILAGGNPTDHPLLIKQDDDFVLVLPIPPITPLFPIGIRKVIQRPFTLPSSWLSY